MRKRNQLNDLEYKSAAAYVEHAFVRPMLASYKWLLLSCDISLTNSRAVRAEMETRNGVLARVSECEGRHGRANEQKFGMSQTVPGQLATMHVGMNVRNSAHNCGCVVDIDGYCSNLSIIIITL